MRQAGTACGESCGSRHTHARTTRRALPPVTAEGGAELEVYLDADREGKEDLLRLLKRSGACKELIRMMLCTLSNSPPAPQDAYAQHAGAMRAARCILMHAHSHAAAGTGSGRSLTLRTCRTATRCGCSLAAAARRRSLQVRWRRAWVTSSGTGESTSAGCSQALPSVQALAASVSAQE